MPGSNPGLTEHRRRYAILADEYAKSALELATSRLALKKAAEQVADLSARLSEAQGKLRDAEVVRAELLDANRRLAEHLDEVKAQLEALVGKNQQEVRALRRRLAAKADEAAENSRRLASLREELKAALDKLEAGKKKAGTPSSKGTGTHLPKRK